MDGCVRGPSQMTFIRSPGVVGLLLARLGRSAACTGIDWSLGIQPVRSAGAAASAAGSRRGMSYRGGRGGGGGGYGGGGYGRGGGGYGRGRGGGGYGRGGGGYGGGGGGGYGGGRGGGGGRSVQRSPAESTSDRLYDALVGMDRAQYPAYRDIIGEWQYPDFTLTVDYVQSDPFAPPSRCRVRVPLSRAGFSKDLYSNKIRTIALCDYLTRMFWREAHQSEADVGATDSGWHGSKGGAITMEKPGQHVLERTSVLLTGDYIEARFQITLPARGRSIEGVRAANILCDELPPIVQHSLYSKSIDKEHIQSHVTSVEDQEYLRKHLLAEHGLIAFVADGAILPRKSGIDDSPMDKSKALRFETPPSLRVELTLPSVRKITGMGIKEGITLIVGGGFHGKSTLLEALEVGVYNHVPGDGREFVVTDPTAVKIRAEDGRNVAAVDISPFINNLPFQKSTRAFSTPDASGSTSQAANIIEAVQAGTTCVLVDEDTCATNFMIRDRRMQELVAPDKEPITPFISRIGLMYKKLGISTILVIGGAGDYFEVADCVIMMDCYEPKDVTQRAKAISAEYAGHVPPSANDASVFNDLSVRYPKKSSVMEIRNGGKGKVTARTIERVEFGSIDIELDGVAQLVEKAQTRAIGDAIATAAEKYMSDALNIREVLERVESDIDHDGLDSISIMGPVGTLARPRIFEIAAALNRLRGAGFRTK